MKRLLFALAGAVGLVASASAEVTVNTWFTTGIKDYTTWDAVTESTGAWSNTDGNDLTGESGARKIALDADAETPLKFTASAAKTIGDKTASVSVKSKVSFTPFAVSAVSSMEVPSAAKGGVIVVKDAEDNLTYYVLAQDSDATDPIANKWTATSIAASSDAVEVTITVTKGTVSGVEKVTYKFGDTKSDTYDLVMSGEITAANYSGCGTIESLSADETPAAFDVDFGTLPTGVASMSVKVGEETLEPTSGYKYRVANGATAVATFVASANYVLNATTHSVTPTADVTYTADNFPVHADEIVAYIGETAYTNLQLAADNVGNGQTIRIANDHVATDKELFFVEKENVLFDLSGYTVTTTEGSHSLAVFGGSVTITNGVWHKTVNSTVVIVGKTASDASYEPTDKRGLPYTQYWGTAYAGTLTVAAGATIKGTTSSNVIKVNNGASVIVDGGTLTSTGPAKQVAIKVDGSGTTATVKAGVIDGTLVSENNATITINAVTAKAADSTFVANYTTYLDNQTDYEMTQSGDVWKITEKSGPQPAPGGKVEPVPGAETPTYKVTATNATGAVELSGVTSGDTLEMTGTNVASITVSSGTLEGVTIKIKGRNGTVIDNGAFIGRNAENTQFTATLKGDAKVTLKIGDEEKQIPVTPTIGDGLVSDPFTVGDNVSTKIAAIPGLTYSLVRSDKLGTGKTETTVASATATETTLTLTDSTEKPDAGFYVIEVTK